MINEDFIAFTGDTGDFRVFHNEERIKELAELFPNVNSILIPRKAEYNLRKYVSKTLLREINPNVDVAVEKCLVLLSNLASTIYEEDNHLEENRWKRLHSKILNNQIGGDNIYKKIINVLKTGTSTGPMLEVVEDDIPNVQSRRYRIPESYYNAGLTIYVIKDKGIIQRRNKIYFEQLNNAMENSICNNLVKIYSKLELLSSEELLAIGKNLVKDGYSTKKGKIMTMRNKHKNHYWKDYDNRSFIEDNIKIFEYLTNRGYMIPSAGDEKSGGRVVDSFTLMPSWIRNEITINGKKLVECDYIALHPNIAMKLYGGTKSFLTHQKVAKLTGINEKDVKIEHLSFFNKNWYGMRESPLFDYYAKNEPDMLSRIYNDKKENSHKITSQKMFKVEVEIMTDVIKHLNLNGIYVLYVYDALLCEEKDKAVVMETMNRIILEHGVQTCVKDTSAIIEVEYAIINKIVGDADLSRITLEEHFDKFRKKYKRYVKKEQFDSQFEILSEFFKYVDEVGENDKKNCSVEFQNKNGDFERIPLFD